MCNKNISLSPSLPHKLSLIFSLSLQYDTYSLSLNACLSTLFSIFLLLVLGFHYKLIGNDPLILCLSLFFYSLFFADQVLTAVTNKYGNAAKHAAVVDSKRTYHGCWQDQTEFVWAGWRSIRTLASCNPQWVSYFQIEQLNKQKCSCAVSRPYSVTGLKQRKSVNMWFWIQYVTFNVDAHARVCNIICCIFFNFLTVSFFYYRLVQLLFCVRRDHRLLCVFSIPISVSLPFWQSSLLCSSDNVR